MKKLEPISQAAPTGSEEAWVQVNFTAEDYPSADGTNRFGARAVEAFIRVVPAAKVEQFRLSQPIQPTYLKGAGLVDCDVAYFPTSEIKNVIQWAMRNGYGVPASPERVDVSEILEHVRGIRDDADDIIARAELIAEEIHAAV